MSYNEVSYWFIKSFCSCFNDCLRIGHLQHEQSCEFISLPNDYFPDEVLSKLRAFTDNKINVTQKLKFVLGSTENIMGKRRKCWLPAFSLLNP